MRRRPAVGVDDDFATSEPAIPVRSADHEFAGRIDVPDRRLGDPSGRQRLSHIGLDDGLHVVGGQMLVEMLGRHHDLGRLDRHAVLVAHRDLALGVRAERFRVAGFSRLGEQF